MKKPFFFSLVILLLIRPVALLAAPSAAWDFIGPEQLEDWKGEGIEASRISRGVWQISGGENIQLGFPPELNIVAQDNPYLRVRLRVYSPRLLQVFWIPRFKVFQLPSVSLQPYFDRNFHTYWIKLAKSPQWSGQIGELGLALPGYPGLVEIDFIEIGPFSRGQYLLDQWKEFWLPRTLTLGTINSLSSPRLLGRPFISWLNKLIVLIFIIGAFFYIRKGVGQKGRIAGRVAIAIVVLWLVYDLRETYGQFRMAETIYQFYLRPAPEQKTFPGLGDFYNFVELCREKIPAGGQYHFYSRPDWPFDCRIQYFLYPRRINSDTACNIIPGDKIPYHAVYNHPDVEYDPESRRLRYQDNEKETIISSPGQISGRLNRDSFVFREEAPAK